MINKLNCFFVLFLFLFIGTTPVMGQEDASSKLYKLFEKEWDFRLKEYPLMATSIGVKEMVNDFIKNNN